MSTQKLYYHNESIKIFTATVTECTAQPKGFAVVLNQTAFYPEGGGQPADIGILDGLQVMDVQEEEGKVLHTIAVPLEVGRRVEGKVDWPHRFSLSQQHTGEHIVSGLIHRLFGLNNVGFHMGSEFVTIDFNGTLSAEQLEEVECRANDAVYANVPMIAAFPTEVELQKLDYRSKKELSGAVRIITIPGYDICACCGTHTNTTGEVGLIKLLGMQRYKGGCRINMLCGKRALQDYGAKHKAVQEIGALLSTKSAEVAGAVEHLLQENTLMSQRLSALQKQLFLEKIQALDAQAPAICLFEEGLAPAELRQFCLLLCKQTPMALLFSGSDKEGYKYALGSTSGDVRPFGKMLNDAFSGKGGGSKELVQGSLPGTKEKLEHFFQAFISPLPERDGGVLATELLSANFGTGD